MEISRAIRAVQRGVLLINEHLTNFLPKWPHEKRSYIETAAEAREGGMKVAAAIDEQNRDAVGSRPLPFLKGKTSSTTLSNSVAAIPSNTARSAAWVLPVSMKAARKAPSSALDTSFLPIIV